MYTKGGEGFAKGEGHSKGSYSKGSSKGEWEGKGSYSNGSYSKGSSKGEWEGKGSYSKGSSKGSSKGEWEGKGSSKGEWEGKGHSKGSYSKGEGEWEGKGHSKGSYSKGEGEWEGKGKGGRKVIEDFCVAGFEGLITDEMKALISKAPLRPVRMEAPAAHIPAIEITFIGVASVYALVGMCPTHEYTKQEMYHFERAMTHKSIYDKRSYELMEFMGDSFYHNVITEYLFERYQMCNEKFMSVLRARLISGNVMYALGYRLRLWRWLQVAEKYECQGIRSNRRIIEDIMEAFIAAIKLVEGFDFTTLFLRSLFEKFIDFTAMIEDKDNMREQIVLHHPNHRFETNLEHLSNGTTRFVTSLYNGTTLLATGPACASKRQAEKAVARMVQK